MKNHILKQKTIVMDFERAIHLAIEQVFPESATVDYRFQLTWEKFSNSTWRVNVQKLGNWLRLTSGMM